MGEKVRVKGGKRGGFRMGKRGELRVGKGEGYG